LVQLEEVLTGSGAPRIQSGEQIARLVPKRNLESWVLCLLGQPVDEATDYKGIRDEWSELIPQASDALFEWTRPNRRLPDHCIDSIRRGVDESKHLAL
jgi:hypothetical protein